MAINFEAVPSDGQDPANGVNRLVLNADTDDDREFLVGLMSLLGADGPPWFLRDFAAKARANDSVLRRKGAPNV